MNDKQWMSNYETTKFGVVMKNKEAMFYSPCKDGMPSVDLDNETLIEKLGRLKEEIEYETAKRDKAVKQYKEVLKQLELEE